MAISSPADLAHHVFSGPLLAEPPGTPPPSGNPEVHDFIALDECRLTELLEAAYRLSMRREEGRFPRLTFFTPRDLRSEQITVPFMPPLLLDQDEVLLGRLGPAVLPLPYALVVHLRGSHLQVVGIGQPESPTNLFRPQCRFMAPCYYSGLYVTIEGPGSITVFDYRWFPQRIYRLRGGRIEAATGVTSARPVHAWLRAAADRLQLTGYGEDSLHGLWTALLSATIANEHGGAFVVLPVEATSEVVCRLLNIRRRIDRPNFAAAITRVCGNQAMELVAREQEAIRLLAGILAAGQLTAVDGCVVLDSALTLVGFGAEITAGQLAACVRLHPHTGQEAGSFDLTTVGMRHGSAARLCAALPGATAFVVSQDGDVSFFSHLRPGVAGVCRPLQLLVGRTAYI